MINDPDNFPCSIGCRKCSRCIRAFAAIRNMERYGTPDYPDAETRQRLDNPDGS